MHTLI